MMYEGKDTTGIVGKYEYDGELAVGKTVVVPSGLTYEIQSVGKNTPPAVPGGSHST
jgi:hypothetical protein